MHTFRISSVIIQSNTGTAYHQSENSHSAKCSFSRTSASEYSLRRVNCLFHSHKSPHKYTRAQSRANKRAHTQSIKHCFCCPWNWSENKKKKTIQNSHIKYIFYLWQQVNPINSKDKWWSPLFMIAKQKFKCNQNWNGKKRKQRWPKRLRASLHTAY